MIACIRNGLLAFAIHVLGSVAFGDEFKDRVKPFLTTYCTSCHGPEKQKGKIRVDHLTASMSDRKEAETWSRMLEAITFGEMPSDKARKFPPKAEARFVQDWIARTLDQAGLAVEEKGDKEGYGNLVSHDLLFAHSPAPVLDDDHDDATYPLLSLIYAYHQKN